MPEEAHRQTHLPRIRTLGLEVIERVVGVGFPHLVVGIPHIDGIGQETGKGKAHRGPRTADLHVGELLGHVGDQLRDDHRGADRRIEERRLDRLRTGQLRGPVVAAREGQIIGALVADFGRGEERLILLAPSGLFAGDAGIIELKDVEDVGQARFHDGAAVEERILLDVGDDGTDVGLERPVVAERLVDVHQHVAVGLLVLGLGDAVESVARTVDDRRVRRGVELLGVVVHGVVDADTARHREPVEDLIREVGVEHVAAPVVLTQVAVVESSRGSAS